MLYKERTQIRYLGTAPRRSHSTTCAARRVKRDLQPFGAITQRCNLMVIPERASPNKTDMLGEPLTGSSSGKTLHTLLIRVIDSSAAGSLSGTARQSQHRAPRSDEARGTARRGRSSWAGRCWPGNQLLFKFVKRTFPAFSCRRTTGAKKIFDQTGLCSDCESCLFAFCLSGSSRLPKCLSDKRGRRRFQPKQELVFIAFSPFYFPARFLFM